MKSQIALVVTLLLANGCAGQSPPQAGTSTNRDRAVSTPNRSLTLEEAKKIVGETRTIEMPVPTTCGVGREVLLQNCWGMIPTLAGTFGFGSISVQKERLNSIPDPIILVVLSTNAVEEFTKNGVTNAGSHFLGSVVRATGKVEVLDATKDKNAFVPDRRLKEFVVIRVNSSADLTIQNQK